MSRTAKDRQVTDSQTNTVLSPYCRARDVLDRVGDKWSVYVITLLGDGTKRFSELKRDIHVITQRMLTVTLRGLERDGFINRTVYPVYPARVEYSLTPLGASLLDTLRALLTWSIDHVDRVDEARQHYDDAEPTDR
ncbi:winged helix-turn-helix transcriptional regulator [Nonomuraea cavernae]|uniref:Transcriptional regulator n=1 Tax=Nonomuraea cavernae TaxID=2045107 RepID=A0A918DLL5_9ACTN|nr:helix-turn-helix domain-containing protein [Nonomuraea cavernae]MCA2187756.1 helix-turn-helix transcriptional regulator [Nonomuraea cavernae]GGO71756.1 transcriptional regulator [Nonomuraea cavernae]